MPNSRSCLDCGQLRLYARSLCQSCYEGRKRAGRALPQRVLRRFEELLAEIVPDEHGCWPWPGFIHGNGYGSCGKQAHVRSYEYHVGPVPDEFDVGHACHDRDKTCLDWRQCQHRRCVNPAHLILQTRSENNRSKPKKTHCRRGHEFTPENTYLNTAVNGRQCRACVRLMDKRRRTRSEVVKPNQ